MYLKDIADLVNDVAAKKGCYKFQPKWINDFLLSIGMLKEEYGRKIPTEDGKALGIIPQEKYSERIGTYYVNTFSSSAQQFILDNIDAVIAFASSNSNASSEQSKSQGKTRSANYCILQGLLDAARMLKKPTKVILLASTPLGFNSKGSPNKALCDEVLSELAERECTVYIASCNGRGEDLVNLINAYRINGN